MKKKLYFLHCKNNVITLIAILLALLFILFIYSYVENNNSLTNIIENFSPDDPLYNLVNCNKNKILTCGNEDIEIFTGSCYESYGRGSANPDIDKFNRCVDLRVPSVNTLAGNVERDITTQTCQSYNSAQMRLQQQATYNCNN